ncbi:hypothetical protein BUALT_Bualt10G0108800 [Buddleja alternifolia]|uniref:Arf-GAP domain-containing protein n=1 Tax=Buddleja alternifolia TaxID=168488 RepID=A0AAV6X8Q6_9LAMI|nr:hypothetical protein BUALT_Bualt10G0108800 [Buddleja alternifolia]
MPRRAKEEERIEMILRGLLKQAENRRCINCNSLGPQYVCTTFWTFVCTNCSGVHREFTHRVKSVSMAKFKEEDIMALQAGGNERARQIYFKAWDPHRNSHPDGSNLHRLREFIKHVYVDRKYAGANNLSMVNLDANNQPNERPSYEKSSWAARGGFLTRRSLERTRDDSYERSSFEKSSPSKTNNDRNFRNMMEERSPRSVTNRSVPTRFEIVDDRFRDDGSVKHYDRCSIRDSRGGTGSPESQGSNTKSFQEIRPVKDIFGDKFPPLKIGEPPNGNDDKDDEGSTRGQPSSQRSTAKSLPEIRPVKDTLGEKVPPLKVGEPPKANDDEGSARGQKVADATNPGPSDEQQKQNKTVNSNSLIDFDANLEPTYNTAAPQAHLTASNNNEKSSSDPSPTNEMSANAAKMDSVESLLFELSAPTTPPSSGTSQMSSGATAAQPNSFKATDVGSLKAPQVSNSAGALSITSQVADNDLRPLTSVRLEKSSQAAESGDGSTPSGRKELPVDLFNSNFGAFPPAIADWQVIPSHGMGYGMQFHHPSMPVAAFPTSPAKPTNPFDIGVAGCQVQAAMFPSMSSLQGALPNMPAATSVQSQPSPYATALSSHVPPYGVNMPLGKHILFFSALQRYISSTSFNINLNFLFYFIVPGAYMGQQLNNIPLTRPQGIASFGSSQDAVASINSIQLARGTDSPHAAPNSSLSRGNPFR